MLNLSAFWVTYYRELKALFENDDEVNVTFDYNSPEVKVYVEDPDKADALYTMLPETKTFGNVELKITVISANGRTPELLTLDETVMETAFRDNPALRQVIVVPLTPRSFGATYVIFSKEVVQFFNDELDDYYGNKNTLYEDCARDVFKELPGVCFSTDVKSPNKELLKSYHKFS